jgi:type I restriction enzyme S subunit
LIDKAIGIKEKQIELLKERRQIMIHQAVTRGIDPNVKLKPSGVEWIGDIPEHWEVKKLKYVIEKSFSGGTPSTDKLDYWDGEFLGFPLST